MDAVRSRLPRPSSLLRIGLALFVVLWLVGPSTLRAIVPIWLAFLIALGLELHFFLGWRRPAAGGRSSADRTPQDVDREQLGYTAEGDELVLVRRGDEEVWLPYSGQTAGEVDEPVAEPEEEALVLTPYVPERKRPRPVRRLFLGVGLIAALAFVTWVVESRRGWSGLEEEARAKATERFSAEASQVARHRVTIRCDEAGRHVGAVQHADGVAFIGGRLAYLTPERCYDLYRLAFEGDFTFSQTARAIAVLAHEAWHLAGVRDEGRTECYALQSGVELGERLGLDESTARRMMKQQLVENASRRGRGAEYRVPTECREGGELDLNPRSSAFP